MTITWRTHSCVPHRDSSRCMGGRSPCVAMSGDAARMSACATVLAAILALSTLASAQKFIILGDRTGEAQPGVFEAALREAAAEKPAFILSLGDNIQGGDDATAESQWQAWE